MNPRLRKIGCGCEECQSLDKFILDPATQATQFRLIQSRRTHLERQIGTALDLCTYQTVRSGSPHSLQVKKFPEVLQACTWDQRRKAARTFLSSIGTDEVIKKIMGMRYADVVAAIKGTTPFGATKVSGEQTSVPTSKNISSGSRIMSATYRLPSGAARALASAVPAQLAGKKRKNTTVNLGPGCS